MHQAPCEEVILDTVLDGAHYLLVRLPQTTHHRVQLSPREQEIVRMVAQGHPNKVIADVLNISSWTVCTHLRRIFAKLGVGSRAAMVARILENGNGREPGAPSYFPSNNAAQPKAPSKQSSIPTGAPLAMTERREAG
jgi:DNA-binding CsgD family transcriptional regulator